MRAITDKIGHFLVTNTVWIFVSAIFFISFNWVMTFRHNEIGLLVYLVGVKWSLYLRFSVALLILFSPTLLFSTFRTWLKKKVGGKLFLLLWLYIFIIHPLVLMQLESTTLFDALSFPDEILVLAFGIPLLLIELMLIGNDYFKKQINILQWLKAIKLEKALIWLISVGVSFVAILATYLRVKAGNSEYSFGITLCSNFIQLYSFLLLVYAFYWLNHYLLVKKILKAKGFLFYFSALILLGLLFYPLFSLTIYYFPMIATKWNFSLPIGDVQAPFSGVEAYLPWLWMFLSFPFILVYQWWKQKNDITTLEKEKSANELNALKQQINPHFLFNTLNSLYALGIEEKSEKTADGIAKLGTLMRYNLNDAQKKFIPLSKEIEYIKKYIELQALRLTKNNQLKVNILDETGREQIAPLLLIPFIENSFKFGVSSTEQTKIDLTITMEKEVLKMHLYNTIIKNRQTTKGNGIGITNTRKRLAHLYPSQYELIIEETPDEFEVHLEINLAEGEGRRVTPAPPS